MSDDWAKRLAEKISGGDDAGGVDPRSAQIVKCAEQARERAAELLFDIFTKKIDAISQQLDQAEGKGGFFQRFRKNPPSVLSYTIEHELTFRFQLREAYGSRLEVNYQRGKLPQLRVDVATAELIEGEYLPIFRQSGAIAGATLWQSRRSEGKHPELIGRLLLILSATAINDGLKITDAIQWIYEENSRAFTTRSAEEMIEQLIAAA